MRSLGLDAGSALSAAQRFKQVAAELKRRDRRDRQEQQDLRRQARQLKRVSDAVDVWPLLQLVCTAQPRSTARQTAAGAAESCLACQTVSDGCCLNGCLTEIEACQVGLNRRAHGDWLPAADQGGKHRAGQPGLSAFRSCR